MKYTVGFNWDLGLIDKIDYPEVESVYGGIGSAVIGGGRAPLVIKDVNEDTIKECIKRVHNKGWDFDFTVNSGCTSNKEFTKEGHSEIVKYLEWVCNLGVDSVTVTLPSLISIVKKYFPNLKIKISTFQRITSVAMAKRFEDLGADAIMICEHSNRDFKLLRALRSAVKCKIALVANVGCVYYCQNAHSHIVSTSHSGTIGECNSIATAIPYTADCLHTRLKDVSEFIKIRYIRPEDVSVYEDLGIDMLKIVDRHTKTDILADRVKAYHERSFDGNLLYIIGQKAERKTDDMNIDVLKKIASQSKEAEEKTYEFFNYLKVSISDLINIDNKKFPNDFLKEFEKKDCTRISCEMCGYCKKISEHIITTAGQDKINEALESVKELKARLVNGNILY